VAGHPRRVKWRRILLGRWTWWRPLASLASIYLILALVAVSPLADRIIFMPQRPSYQADAQGLAYLTTPAGEKIATLHLAAVPGMATLLYSHGNAEDLGQAQDLYEAWHNEGFGVLAYDYPGYGESSGKPSEESCQRAIQAAWDQLRASGVPAESIVVIGRSVGSGPSTWLAAREQPAGLVLISGFTSVFGVRPPATLLPGNRFRNLQLIRRMATPLLVIHGTRDTIIPMSHGEQLRAASAATDKTLLPIPNAGHNDIFDIQAQEIHHAISTFARRVAN
jgi:alpha-beta hydrolase superfamily lysophospholipase